MSLIDDQTAEIDQLIDIAWQRCLYGKTYSPAYEVARRIRDIRKILAAKEEENVDANLTWLERRLLMQAAGILLMGALTSSKKLREVANALDAGENESAGQANILRAYEDCVQGRYPPTIIAECECFVRCSIPTYGQLRDRFITRFPDTCCPSEQGLRKTLKTFGLPLRRSKRGRPVGSKSVIHNRKS